MKNVLTTGANKGIGFQAAMDLARPGEHVIIGSRDEQRGKEALQRITSKGFSAELLVIDVSKKTSVQNALDELKRRELNIDVLINNAGIFIDKTTPILELEDDNFELTLDTNFRSAFYLSKAIIPGMINRGYGRVVNISSGLGTYSTIDEGGYASYRLSKLAMNGLTKILAAEVDHDNVLINSVCPGWVRSDMGGPNAERSLEKGAETIVWAATLEENISGGFFRDKKPAEW